MKHTISSQAATMRFAQSFGQSVDVSMIGALDAGEAVGPVIYTLPSDGALAAEIRELRTQVDALRAEFASAKRRVVSLSTLGDARYRLRLPISVELTESDGSHAAFCPDLETFGEAGDELSAIADLRDAIVEDFAFLKANEQELGPGPAAQLARFRELLESE